jgi:hypothetical protein
MADEDHRERVSGWQFLEQAQSALETRRTLEGESCRRADAKRPERGEYRAPAALDGRLPLLLR